MSEVEEVVPVALRTHNDEDGVDSSVESGAQSQDDSRAGAGSVASGDEVGELPVEETIPPVRPSVAALRSGLEALVFALRGSLMRSVPRFLWGSFRVTTKLALEEIVNGEARHSELQQEQTWKLFLLLPRKMFHRSPAGGGVPKARCRRRPVRDDHRPPPPVVGKHEGHRSVVHSCRGVVERATSFGRLSREK